MTTEETRCCDWEWEVTETEEGFRVELKGDKEKLKAGIEAIQALVAFWTKAQAVGWCCCYPVGFGFPPAFAHHPVRGHWHRGPMACCCC